MHCFATCFSLAVLSFPNSHPSPIGARATHYPGLREASALRPSARWTFEGGIQTEKGRERGSEAERRGERETARDSEREREREIESERERTQRSGRKREREQVCLGAPSESGYAEGDLVMAKWTQNSVWYNATIAEARSDGTYVVDWEAYSPNDREKSSDEIRPRVRAEGGGAPPPGYEWYEY